MKISLEFVLASLLVAVVSSSAENWRIDDLAPHGRTLLTVEDQIPEFYLPPYEDYNLTFADINQTTGYNPWMPRYNGGDPTKTTYIMLNGGCIPVEEGGSSSYQDAPNGFFKKCRELDIECQCRPIISSRKWNVGQNNSSPTNIYQGLHHCTWEILRTLEEHRRGTLNIAGISAKCDFRHPKIYDLAREIGVPLFLTSRNPLEPNEEEYGGPEPDGYIGPDQKALGSTMARVLKQLKPEGGNYGFVMQWESNSALRQRAAFNEEMADGPNDGDARASWSEVNRYPYERPYNLSVPCNHLDCQMDGLINNTDVDSLIFLFTTPLRNPKYPDWVDANSHRGLTLISRGTVQNINMLSSGYVNGLVGEIHYEIGYRSVEVLVDVAEGLKSGKHKLPLKDNYFETKLLAHSLIPLNLDESTPTNLDQNLLGGLVYIGYALFGIVMLTSGMAAVWTYMNRSKTIVQSAQPLFLLLLVSGIVIFASTIIPLSFDDDGSSEEMTETFAVGVCMSQPWLAFIGFSVIFSALFSKTWRINRLFHSTEGAGRMTVSYKDVMAPFAALVTCNVIVLACWTAIDPLKYTRFAGEGTDFWNREIESYGACRSDHTLAFLIPLATINMIVLGIACWQAFEARNIQSAFSESTFIGYSVASLLQAFLTGFPILVIVRDDPRAFYMMLALMIFVLSEGILLLIFLPKLLQARAFSKMTPAQQHRHMSEQIATSRKRGSCGSGSTVSGSLSTKRASVYFRERAAVKDPIRKEKNVTADNVPLNKKWEELDCSDELAMSGTMSNSAPEEDEVKKDSLSTQEGHIIVEE